MKLLLAVDGSICAWHALSELLRLFPLRGAEVHVIAVAQPERGYGVTAPYILEEIAELRGRETRARLEAARKALEAGGVQAVEVFREGEPAAEILAYAGRFQPDLLVLGSHGYGTVNRLMLGSVSDAVAHRWTGAVMIVRPSATLIPVSKDERTVGSVMTSHVIVARVGYTAAKVAALMKTHDTGFIPVLDGDTLVGVVTDRDLALRVVAEPGASAELPVERLCTPKPVWVAPDMPVAEAVELMERHRIRRLAVLDGCRLVGVVSLGDLAETEPQAADHALVSISRSPKTLAHRRP